MAKRWKMVCKMENLKKSSKTFRRNKNKKLKDKGSAKSSVHSYLTHYKEPCPPVMAILPQQRLFFYCLDLYGGGLVYLFKLLCPLNISLFTYSFL